MKLSMSTIIFITLLMVALGYSEAGSGIDVFWDSYESFFNPGLTEEIQLNPDDSLIVLSES